MGRQSAPDIPPGEVDGVVEGVQDAGTTPPTGNTVPPVAWPGNVVTPVTWPGNVVTPVIWPGNVTTPVTWPGNVVPPVGTPVAAIGNVV